MRDKNSGEVAKTFHRLGFYKKFQDAGYMFGSKNMKRQEDPGLADGIFVGYGGKAAFIEAKSGSETRFDFDDWNPRQREFAIACSSQKIPYFLFINLGVKILDKRYPRQVILITGAQLAAAIEDRKSIPYDEALTRWNREKLTWVGSGIWMIPLSHPFWEVIYGD